jgi:hypothetical protein
MLVPDRRGEYNPAAERWLVTAFAVLFGGAILAGALALGLGLQDVVRRRAAERAPARPPPAHEHEPIRHW